ncbi:MAG: ribosome recycling factor [bacterium]|nr:ribosome recycling factor [bacterium]
MEDILRETEAKMKKTVDVLSREFAAVRAGRATPALLDRITVDYYGTPTPINQMATITIPEPRLIVIQPWDRTQLGAIERAILKSDLGITPSNDGNLIRLAVPQLTQERRLELVKGLRRKAEEERVAIRNLRREANDMVRELKDEGEISEDDGFRGQAEVQKLTDRYVAEVDRALEAKEKEVMEV